MEESETERAVMCLLNQIYYVNPKLEGQKVELWETLKELEVLKENIEYD